MSKCIDTTVTCGTMYVSKDPAKINIHFVFCNEISFKLSVQIIVNLQIYLIMNLAARECRSIYDVCCMQGPARSSHII